MHIHFRSLFSQGKTPGNSLQKKKLHGSDWDSIRPYFNNDAKYIFWKKSTLNIVEKTFHDSGSIPIITGIIDDFGDDFQIEDTKNLSRKQWKQQSEKIIKESADFFRYSYTSFWEKNIQNFTRKIQKFHIKNHCIFIFSQTFEEKSLKHLQKIAKMNEIIYIVGYHYFEAFPNNHILMKGKIFPKKYLQKYQNELQKTEDNCKKILAKMGIFFIRTFTNQPIHLTLNHFFKNVYAKK